MLQKKEAFFCLDPSGDEKNEQKGFGAGCSTRWFPTTNGLVEWLLQCPEENFIFDN